MVGVNLTHTHKWNIKKIYRSLGFVWYNFLNSFVIEFSFLVEGSARLNFRPIIVSNLILFLKRTWFMKGTLINIRC